MTANLIRRHPRIGLGLALATGLAIGLGLGSSRTPRLRASGADRWQDRIVATGPIAVEVNKMGTQVDRDALYYLNYHTGLLLACVPSYTQGSAGAAVLGDFAERDLVKDFDIKPGATPHFLMTTANLGLSSEGWAPLFVFETETGQVATYRIVPRSAQGSNQPQFLLLERKTDTRLARALAAKVAVEGLAGPR